MERLAPPQISASGFRRFAELVAASAFAVAQPLFVRLASQSPFLLDTGTTRIRLIVLVAVIYLGPPLLLWAGAALAGRWRPQLGSRLHAASVGGLVFLFCLQMAQRWISGQWLTVSGIGGYLAILVSVGAAACVARQLRRRAVQLLFLLTAVGSLLFPIQFLKTGAGATILTPPGPPLQVTVGRPAPVVLMIFDEFCGVSLWNGEREIDAVRYPNFARLAARGNWYRNATTVHARTNYAVPALLTGRMPLSDRETTLAEAPQNLFTLLQSAGYRTAAFEPISRLHPPVPHELRTDVTSVEWGSTVLSSLGIVYAHAVLPRDVPVRLPGIPRVWYGIADQSHPSAHISSTAWLDRDASDVDAQFERFVDCLPRSAEPAVCVLHAMTPHCPWQFLPSGERYLMFDDRQRFPTSGVGSLLEDWVTDELPVRQAWQRHLLQLGDVDRRLGIVLDRLEQSGILDESLIVVTGDHGVSFRPGHSRRVPDGANLADVLSVPLIIKLPGQRAGSVSDRNVESIDVLPTIAAALDMELPEPVDGDSLLDPAIAPRARKSIRFEGGSTVATAEFSERLETLDRMLATFGSGTQDDRLWAPQGPHAELVGRDLSAFAVSPGRLRTELADTEMHRSAGASSCCLCLGRIIQPEAVSAALPLAIAVRGKIIGTSQTTLDPRLPGRWSCLATGLESGVECEELQVFVIRTTDGVITLEECEIAIVTLWTT